MEYKTPIIKRVVLLNNGCGILSGSVVDKSFVKTMGQEVVEYDFSDNDFNHDWE